MKKVLISIMLLVSFVIFTGFDQTETDENNKGGSGTFTVKFKIQGSGKITGKTVQKVKKGKRTLMVKAIPKNGYVFSGWTGDYTRKRPRLRIKNVQSNMTVTATFTKDGDTGGGGGTSGSGKYIITYVNDNLDPQDGTLMAKGLGGLGLKQETIDKNVSSSNLKKYLQQNVEMLYHTGHGNNNSVATSNGSISGGSGTTINATNTIWATCLTLKDNENWKKSMGSSAKTVMGYIKVSFDGTDNQQVNKFIDHRKNGKTYLQAWYLSNNGINNLKDRWAAWAREGSNIVRYQAGGNNPKAIANDDVIVSLDTAGKLKATMSVLETKTNITDAFRRMAIQTKAKTVVYDDMDDFRFIPETTMSRSQAIALAKSWLKSNGALSEDAVLSEVDLIERISETDSISEIIGYSVRFERYLDDLPICGNGVADHIIVFVSNDMVLHMSKLWPDMATQKTTRNASSMLQPGEAITLAAEELSAAIKGPEMTITKITPVYGTYGPDSDMRGLVPAYELESDDGATIVIDAANGIILK